MRATVIVCSLFAFVCGLGYGQDSGTFGVGVKVSTLGAGAEAAVRITHRTNLRAGFNAMEYSRNFTKDGIPYSGQLDFKSFEAHYDIFPLAGGFHISPGVLVYTADPITGTATVAGGQNFSLGGVDYVSDPQDPVNGKGKITFNRAAPTVTVGFGNLISRKEGHHFSVPFEVGAAFQGAPKASLSLTGSACDPTLLFCQSVSNPTIQSNVVAEQNKVNNSMSFFKVYPIISVGIGYKF